MVDFARYRQGRKAGKANALLARAGSCRHCGAALGEGESEDECSSAGFAVEATRLPESSCKFYAE